MGGAYGEIALQPVVGDDIGNVFRQAGTKIVVNSVIGFTVAEQSREQQYGKNHQRPYEMLCHTPGQFGGVRDERTMLRFL